MSDTVPAPPGGDLSTADLLARMPEVRRWQLRVAEVDDPTPQLRRIRLTSPELAELTYAPGQDLMVLVDTSAGRVIRRRYTIRRLARPENLLDLHVVADTDGPGSQWARRLTVGDPVEAVGPRGKITLAADTDQHLFVGDECATPAISAMVEALPPGSRAIIITEVPTRADQLAIEPVRSVEVDWTWLHRDSRPAGDPNALLKALTTALTNLTTAGSASYPHAYVAGEAAVVARLRGALVDAGFPATAVSAKAYWGRGRANASHGEPLRDVTTTA